ncbi:MAG: hypothetical protein LBD89_03065 [Tannerellaceae bacterium]|jgi:hypothetical protein|nr:hypothetical protein [Tannerellaceae bacterium]
MKGKTFRYDEKEYSLDTPFNYLLLLGVSFFFWANGYVSSIGYPIAGDSPATPLWNLVCRMLPNKTVTYLAGVCLTVGGAFLIYRTNYLLLLIREKTLLPLLLYLLLISTNPDFFPLKSTSLGIFCLTLAFYRLLTSYHKAEGAVQKIFHAAFFLGTGSLLWVHLLWFLPVFWLGMYHFKILTLRTFLSSLLGVGVVYWFLLGWCVWRHDYDWFRLAFAWLGDVTWPEMDSRSFPGGWLRILLLVFFTAASILHILLHEYDESLRTRKFLFFLILLTVVSFGLFLMYRHSSEEFLGIICMPVSLLLSHFFTVQKGKRKLRWYYLFVFLFIFFSLLRIPWIS